MTIPLGHPRIWWEPSAQAVAATLAIASLCGGCGGTTSTASSHVAGKAAAAPVNTSTTMSATAPTSVSATVPFEDAKDGFQLEYPADWSARNSKEFTLMLVPVAAPPASGSDTDLAGSKMTVDVPDLPPHFPGMITLGPMQWHYVSEQKGRFSDVSVTEKTDVNTPGTSARRLVLSGHAKNADGSAGAAYTVVTLLEIHGDRVYLVSAEARSGQYPVVRAAFDQVVASMRWTK